MNATTEESKKFWEEKEKEKGGKVLFFTFATFLGKTDDKQMTLGGLLYIVDDRVYFEDFEKDNWFAKITSRKKNYEKTEFSFDISDIDETKIVLKGNALNCIAGNINDGDTKSVSNILKALFQSAVQVRLKKSYSYFFDIMRDNDFLKALQSN